MESELLGAVVVCNTLILDPNSSVFNKYKQGNSHPSAPFKLYQPELSGLSGLQKDQQIGEEKEKNRRRGPYRRYTVQERLQAVECVRNGQDINSVSQKYKIPRRNLVRWKKEGCQKKEGQGRPTDKEMENMVLAKIKQGELTDLAQIRAHAILLSKSENFKASSGWFFKFSQRHHLKLPENKIPPSTSNGDIQSTGSIQN